VLTVHISLVFAAQNMVHCVNYFMRNFLFIFFLSASLGPSLSHAQAAPVQNEPPSRQALTNFIQKNESMLRKIAKKSPDGNWEVGEAEVTKFKTEFGKILNMDSSKFIIKAHKDDALAGDVLFVTDDTTLSYILVDLSGNLLILDSKKIKVYLTGFFGDQDNKERRLIIAEDIVKRDASGAGYASFIVAYVGVEKIKTLEFSRDRGGGEEGKFETTKGQILEYYHPSMTESGPTTINGKEF
jgi:hypothetical protein